jgi:hypothetical protein
MSVMNVTTMKSAASPLVMVEVIPLNISHTGAKDNDADGIRHPFGTCPPISTSSVKLQLLNMSRQGMFSEGWLDAEATEETRRKERRRNGKNYSDESNLKPIHKTNSSQSRGLWLKSTMHSGSKFDLCLPSAKSSEKRIVCVHGPSQTFHQTIISGDLIFQGKDECKHQRHTKSIGRMKTSYVTYLRSDDPLCQHGVPCYLRGYIFAQNEYLQYFRMPDRPCVVTTGTIVHICPHLDVFNDRGLKSSGHVITESISDFLHATLSGRLNVLQNNMHGHVPQSHIPPGVGREWCVENSPHYSTLSCFDKQTIDSLSLRMSTMLGNTVWIGTTQVSLSIRKSKFQELELMDREVRAFRKLSDGNPGGINQTLHPSKTGEKISAVPLLLREGALLVHNTHPNSGKSTLVEAVAADVLKCDAVHVISAPALFAKYGTSADAALESVLHELALKCAVKGGPRIPKICIVLDHLETFLPSSRQASSGDPYSPVLNAMSEFKYHFQGVINVPY